MTDMQTRADTAQVLEAEAREVLERLDLLNLLASRFGEVAITGSLAYGLMVWRDMDIHMPVAPEARIDWMRLGPELAQRMEAVGMRLHRGTISTIMSTLIRSAPVSTGASSSAITTTAPGRPTSGAGRPMTSPAAAPGTWR